MIVLILCNKLIIGQNAHAQALFKQSLELYHESGDKLGIASALMELANALRYDNDYKRIPILCAQSFRLYQEIEDMWGIAIAHTLLDYTAMNEPGDYQTARVHFTYGLTLQRQIVIIFGLFTLYIVGKPTRIYFAALW